MIRIEFELALLVFLPLWLYRRGSAYLDSEGKLDVAQEFLLNLFFVYGLAVAYLTLFPFVIPESASRRFNATLFSEMVWLLNDPVIAVTNIVGNILLFVPLGMLLPLLHKGSDSFLRVTLAGLLCSLTIEGLQYLTAVRASDVDDLLLNTIGAALGFGFFLLGRKLFRALGGPERRSV